jgi:diacylglycerol kinase
MSRVDTTQRAPRSPRVAEDGVERGVGRAMEPPEGVSPERRMLIDARRDERMRGLEQDRGRAAEGDEQLAVEPARDRISREDADVRHTRSVGLLRSFRFALDGVSYLIRTQRNARIELAIGAAVIVVAAWVRVSAVEWAVLILAIALVLGLETLNTALEIAVTLASPERHPLAKAAKDLAAATVLLASLAAVGVGAAILGPHIGLAAGQ